MKNKHVNKSQHLRLYCRSKLEQIENVYSIKDKLWVKNFMCVISESSMSQLQKVLKLQYINCKCNIFLELRCEIDAQQAYKFGLLM